MNGIDYLIISGVKKLFLGLPGGKGSALLFGQYLGFNPFAPIIGSLVIGGIVFSIIGSTSFQNYWKNAGHKDLITNIITIGGIVIIVVALL